jgi:SAM-dependent methyltransferase
METAINLPAAYHGLGWFYDRHWRGLVAKAMPALARLVLSRLPPHARVLDLCCGTGHVAAALARRGFRVTGLDACVDMLRFARQNAPGVDFLTADARHFCFRPCFDAVVSTFDSLNHLLSVEDLEAALRNVQRALVPGGLFVFDLNMGKAFRNEWNKSSTIAEADHLCYVRGRFDKELRLGVTDITTFRLNGNWTRQDLTIYQRCYGRSEVRSALRDVGFVSVNSYTAKALGMRGRLSIGRACFVARK